jgi:hypothetical protein
MTDFICDLFYWYLQFLGSVYKDELQDFVDQSKSELASVGRSAKETASKFEVKRFITVLG